MINYGRIGKAKIHTYFNFPFILPIVQNLTQGPFFIVDTWVFHVYINIGGHISSQIHKWRIWAGSDDNQHAEVGSIYNHFC